MNAKICSAVGLLALWAIFLQGCGNGAAPTPSTTPAITPTRTPTTTPTRQVLTPTTTPRPTVTPTPTRTPMPTAEATPIAKATPTPTSTTIPAGPVELKRDDGLFDGPMSLSSDRWLSARFTLSEFGISGPQKLTSVKIYFTVARDLVFTLQMIDLATTSTVSWNGNRAQALNQFSTYDVGQFNFISSGFYVVLYPTAGSGEIGFDITQPIDLNASRWSSGQGASWTTLEGDLMIRVTVGEQAP